MAFGKDHKRAFLAFADVGVQFAGLAEGHPDRRGKILAQGGHPEGKHVDSGVGLAVVPQRTGNPSGGVLRVPWTYPRADTLLQILHNLRGDAAVYIFSFGCVLHCLLLQKTNFFFAKPANGLRAFSGADLSRARLVRVHRRPLTGSTAGKTPAVKGRGLSGEKMEKKTSSAKNTEWRRLFGQAAGRGL